MLVCYHFKIFLWCKQSKAKYVYGKWYTLNNCLSTLSRAIPAVRPLMSNETYTGSTLGRRNACFEEMVCKNTNINKITMWESFIISSCWISSKVVVTEEPCSNESAFWVLQLIILVADSHVLLFHWCSTWYFTSLFLHQTSFFQERATPV